jgi:hypothetical protein
MRNVLDKRYRENQNTHFMFNNFFFSENRTVYDIMSKNMVEPEGPQMTSQYGAYALHGGLTRLQSRTRMHTPTSPGTYMHARTRRPILNTYCFSTVTIICERASVLRYTYIFCLVVLLLVKHTSYVKVLTIWSFLLVLNVKFWFLGCSTVSI